ncbi:MAG: DUF1553 domain-containing protein [Akkermansiaceae bacterium]|nr:DUF1553 domain-containing protein [Akkermansiaceae bacterium]MCP5549825.1 DUF1553 domain-containing protein [Akkermansiaceae bacterium]
MTTIFRPWSRLVPGFLLALSAPLFSSAEETPAKKPLNFVNDIVPILTKADCNTGACHAKAITGQRGFLLSLLGFEPELDYEQIVKSGRGRRVFPPAPDQSLLMLKAANIVPHGGGKKLDPDSEGYRTLVRWVSEGMPYGAENDPKLVGIDVSPNRKTMPVNASQALKVTARYSDGSTRDVTGMALYEANDRNMAEASGTGLVKTLDLPGNVAVMVRYSGFVSVFNIAIPLGAPVDTLPPAKNFIDELVFANLKTLGIPPSPACDDETFLRRVSLDIGGRLPTVEETKAFLESQDPKKRDLAIESLLNSPDYADFFANKWTALLKNRREDKADIMANFAFHAWMRDSLLANVPYDEIVRQVLGATGTIVSNPPVAWYKRVKEPNQQLEDVAQLFLGVRMQCAQCHHHPFERWSQNDYYALSAFFSQVGRKPTAVAGEDLIFHKRGIAEVENKKTGDKVRPAGLGQAPPEISPDEDPRLTLADWMAEKSNPFFATVLVNRYWKHFFKRGLVEPEDDLRDTNPATNPELLAALSKYFIESGFDLKAVVRVIAQSQTYQLSEQPNEHNAVDHQNFSHFYPKRLPAEVLLDAIDGLTEAKTDFPDLPPGTRAIALPDNSYNKSSAFLKVFGRPEGASVCECERVQGSSLAQSLHLMNSTDVKGKLAVANGRADRLSKPEVPVMDGIREIYQTAFGREPTGEELSIAEDFLVKPRTDAEGKAVDPARAKRQAYEDLLWAIMNTKEFLYNH